MLGNLGNWPQSAQQLDGCRDSLWTRLVAPSPGCVRFCGRITVVLPWVETRSDICERGAHALRWGFAEPWFQTETFVALDSAANANGWQPLPMEVPYVTFEPVQLPKPKNRDWASQGAVKWVDLCLHSKDRRAWCWVEFKVRQTNNADMALQAALNARDVVRKDVVALMALDAQRTADTWENPDQFTKAYWFDETLSPYIEDVRQGQHSFPAVYLQLCGEFNRQVWGDDLLQEAIHGWWVYRTKHVAQPLEYRQMQLEYATGLPGGHSALIVSGTL